MKVSCLQESLSRGLKVVGRAASARSILPVMTHVLLSTDEGRLRLSATNLEIAINCWIDAQVEEDGAIAVPARTLTDLAKALSSERTELEVAAEQMTLGLRCGRSRANIKGMEASEFPPVSAPEGESEVRLDPETLRTAVAQVAFAAAADESRATLTGVLIRVERDQMTLAAADGYRLSVRTVPLPESVTRAFSVIVPARAMAELARISKERISKEQEEPVSITVTPDGSRVVFGLTDVVLVSQLIPGTFPDYRRVIPQDWTTRGIVGTREFLKACRAALIFAREGAWFVRLVIRPKAEPEPGEIAVSAPSAETGSGTSRLDAGVEGEPVEIAFNVRYLIDVLSVVSTPQVMLDIVSPSQPGVIRQVGDDGFVHVIMPMALVETQPARESAAQGTGKEDKQ